MYGHTYGVAEAVAAGAPQVPGAEVALYQVPELMPEEALVKAGAKKTCEVLAHIPVAEMRVVSLALTHRVKGPFRGKVEHAV